VREESKKERRKEKFQIAAEGSGRQQSRKGIRDALGTVQVKSSRFGLVSFDGYSDEN